MRTLRPLFFSVLILALPSSAPADHHLATPTDGMPKWTEAQQEVWKAVQAISASYTTAPNLDVFTSLIHESFLGWYDNTPTPDTKEEIRNWAKNAIKTRQTVYYRFAPTAIQVLGDTAVVFELWSWLYKDAHGKETFERGHYTGVWKKEGGKWLLISESGATHLRQ